MVMPRYAPQYNRIAKDKYLTPAWVTMALIRNWKLRWPIWEPCAADGQMAALLQAEWVSRQNGKPWGSLRMVRATDVAPDNPSVEFWDIFNRQLNGLQPDGIVNARSIVTNPPYTNSERFVRRALDMAWPSSMVAMLLPHEWDCASGRQDLLDRHPAWKCKLTLCRRIEWFAGKAGSKDNSTTHHAWYIWDWNPFTPRLGLMHIEKEAEDGDHSGRDGSGDGWGHWRPERAAERLANEHFRGDIPQLGPTAEGEHRERHRDDPALIPHHREGQGSLL